MDEKKTAPYAPATAVVGIIRHYRDRDVPPRVSLDSLRQIGITDALVHRTLSALKFLGLLDEDGSTTDSFRRLRLATQEEYPEALAGVLDTAYADILQHVDAGAGEYRDVSNAFIPYTPGTQRKKMISLFLGLAKEAGWGVGTRAANPSIDQPTRRERKPARGIKPARAIAGVAPSAPSGSVVFAVTDRDMAALDEGEFNEVWLALGKVARARARSQALAGIPALDTEGER